MFVCSAILGLVVFLLVKSNMSIESSPLVETDPYQLSTHVLDVSRGRPAQNVTVHLHASNANETSEWKLLDSNRTDSNGRIKTFLSRKIQPHYKGKFIFKS